jgi:hypothetical protein
MAMSKPKPKRRLWRTLAFTLGGIVVFALLFIAAFVFNPFEGSLPELRDVVPRGVNFFARKARLADDFDPFPEPKFWSQLVDAPGFAELQRGALGQAWKRNGVDRAVQQAAAAFEQVRTDSGGWLDLMRDAIGDELLVAGYEQDYSAQPPRPLPAPWWCVYTRVSWRVKAALGLAGFGMVQSRMQAQGLDVANDGDLLVIKPQGAAGPLYVKRHLDLVMVANHKLLLEQSQRLIDGNRDEEPIGQMAAYTDTVKRIEKWTGLNAVDAGRAVEFVVEPNAFDGFRRFAASWPNPQNRDSMNERVLASFLNLKGWSQIAGGLMFGDGLLACTGQVGLNSKQHTPFQSSFYRAEQQRREEWLDPFLRMVPETACAAAALRMPAGEFLTAMFESLEDAEKQFLDDAMRRATFQGTQLSGVRDLIDRIKVAFLPRTGFVFSKNKPDTSRDKDTGELMVPVAQRSPVPQVAWVFWLRPGASGLLEELVTMMRAASSTFNFRKVWHLKVPFRDQFLPEPVTEFVTPAIPGTGEIAVIVFRDFFVLSNSGPLIRDIITARYRTQTGAKSVLDNPEFQAALPELASDLSGLVWIDGANLVPVLDGYASFADAASEVPDPEWLVQERPAVEDQVRRASFAQYPSKASMPKAMTEAGGEFDRAVVAQLREQWRRQRTSFTAEDRAQMEQLRGMAQLLKAGVIQLELDNNSVRFQMRLATNLR